MSGYHGEAVQSLGNCAMTHLEPKHDEVTEWTTNPPIWVADDVWGVTVTTHNSMVLDLPADLIRDLARALDQLEPMGCRECSNLADPETGDDQTCREHAPSRRWRG